MRPLPSSSGQQARVRSFPQRIPKLDLVLDKWIAFYMMRDNSRSSDSSNPDARTESRSTDGQLVVCGVRDLVCGAYVGNRDWGRLIADIPFQHLISF